jgi:hypothetical protein
MLTTSKNHCLHPGPACGGRIEVQERYCELYLSGVSRSLTRAAITPRILTELRTSRLGQLAQSQNLARGLVKAGWCGREGYAGPDAALSGIDHAGHLPAVRAGESAAGG